MSNMDLSTGLEVISEEECLKLLSAHNFGRIGVDLDDGPMIFPLNYATDGKSIIIRTRAGAKLDAAPMTKVAFEIDGIGPSGESGWSVVVRGIANDITTSIDDYDVELQNIYVSTLTGTEKDRVLRINMTHVTGRRFGSS